MGGRLTIYGDSVSGNCHKVRAVARHLGVDFDWVEISVLDGGTRTQGFLAINPAGQVPAVVLPDGRSLAQSGAIMLYLAEGSALIPQDAYDRAQMMSWMFWEQYSHEPLIAVRRFKKLYLRLADEEIDPALLSRGHAALALMDRHLSRQDWFAGRALSLADVALVAYTRLAHEGGYDLQPYPALRRWIAACEAQLPL